MTFEAADVVASVLKAVQPDRSLAASQRVAGITQDELAAQTEVQADMRKVETSDKMEKSRLKREEQKRERKHAHPHQSHPPVSDGQEHLIDTVA